MSNTPNYDAKVKAILDATTPGERTCAITGRPWVLTSKEIALYQKHQVPPMDICHLARQWVLTTQWPGGQWWYNQHAETGKPIITAVHPASGIRVLPDEEWYARDFSEICFDLDVAKPVFPKLIELRKLVPTSAYRNYEKTENSISVVSLGDQNSYFVVLCRSKNTFFSVSALDTESSAEVFNSSAITNSYQVIHCERMFNCQYVRESKDCLNSAFLFDCRNCEYCFGATNKRNKKYVWFNEQLSQSEWEKRRDQVDLGSRRVALEFRLTFDALVRKAIWPENFNDQCQNSIGEYLTKATDCEYVWYADGGARDEYHTSYSIGRCEGNAFSASIVDAQDLFMASDNASSFRCKYSYLVGHCQNVEYSTDCFNCENCFGCVGLRHMKFCILNKQYSEEEYWRNLDALKCAMLERGEYGQFLPAKMSPSYFPECGAFKYYNADPAFGKKIGAHTFEAEAEGAIGSELSGAQEVTDSKNVPDNVDDLDGWSGKPLYDAGYKRRFSLIGPEVTLYKKLRIAPPVEHFVKRYADMCHTANLGEFIQRPCAKCNKIVVISVNPTYPDRTIYCREDYLKFIEANG